MNLFSQDIKTAYEARSEAQRIAFAPIVFQSCRLLRDSGILEVVHQSRATGLTLGEVAGRIPWPRYGVKVLMESGLGIGLFCLIEERFTLTKLGFFMLRDPMTRVNMDVMHEVCYRGMFDLDQSIQTGRPEGLKSLGGGKTLYEALSSFTPQARDSWLAFDHYYSDQAFPAVLPLIFADPPRCMLDVGGNTGRWAVQCTKFNPDVRVTIADLPMQLQFARETIRQNALEARVDLFPIDLLDSSAALPEGHDAIWMSQFLDCFSEKEIVSILQRVAHAMTPETSLYILELFWDRQPNETAAFCLQQTSLYFTCIANGNSQMYHSRDLIHCLAESGLKVVEERDGVGSYHTLWKCRKV